MKTKQTKTKEEYRRSIEDLYMAETKKQWKDSQQRFMDEELLKIFPEAKRIIPEKVKKLRQEQKESTDVISKDLQLIGEKVKDEFSQQFWKEWVKYSQVSLLNEVDKQLSRFYRLQWVSQERKNYKRSKSHISEEDIQQARKASIEDIAIPHLEQVRKVGENYIALCPFHQEKRPSFYLYIGSNSYHCYGCGAHGDVINLIMELHNLTFLQAVRFLKR